MYGLILVGLIISGFLIGKIAHKFLNEKLLNIFSKVIGVCQNISIFILLLMMGYKIGSNRELIASFSRIGLHSVLFGIGTLLVSSAITWILIFTANKIHIKRHNKKLTGHIAFSPEDESDSQLHSIVMIIVFLSTVILGGILGYINGLSVNEAILEKMVDSSLMALVFFIGADMGLSQLDFEHLKSIGKNAVLICLGVVSGSLLGALAIGALLKYDALFSIAVGSPMGWYSLAGIMLSKIDAELGAVAFTANLTRELTAMALMPIIGSLLSPDAAIAACGATAMDTTLPAITKGLGKRYAPLGFACGIIISSIVPIFLPIIQTIYDII